MGHRAHFRVEQEEGTGRDLASSRLQGADPRLEGIADAFDDRYSGVSHPDFRHHTYRNEGYSTQHWQEQGGTRAARDRNAAIYTATRAHFAKTGEVVPIGLSHSHDEYLDRLVSTSPHAVKALRQTGLKHVAAQAVERYRNTRFAGFQHELPFRGTPANAGKIVYDIPETHGSLGPQFGKT